MGAPFNATCLAAAWCATAALAAATPAPVTVTGCVTRTDARVLLLPESADARSATSGAAGSNTSKASTPVRGGQFAGDRASSGGTTMSAKGSTPIRRGNGLLDSAGTGGAYTSKASTPVGRRKVDTAAYELDLRGVEPAEYVGQTVAVTGMTDGSAAAPKLAVESIRVMSASCSTPLATR